MFLISYHNLKFLLTFSIVRSCKHTFLQRRIDASWTLKQRGVSTGMSRLFQVRVLSDIFMVGVSWKYKENKTHKNKLSQAASEICKLEIMEEIVRCNSQNNYFEK